MEKKNRKFRGIPSHHRRLQIDLAAHLGGALSGALVAYLWGPRYVWPGTSEGRPVEGGIWAARNVGKAREMHILHGKP